MIMIVLIDNITDLPRDKNYKNLLAILIIS